MIVGYIINKFRGDISLYKGAIDEITNRTNFKICVFRTPQISNFDDLDPLFQTKNITVQVIENGQALTIDCDMILLVGSKSTISDLKYIKDCGWVLQLVMILIIHFQ